MPRRWQPTGFTAGRDIRIEGTTYARGASIPKAVVARMKHLAAYLSRRFIIPMPDPHLRRTTPQTPTPTSLNPTETRKIADG